MINPFSIILISFYFLYLLNSIRKKRKISHIFLDFFIVNLVLEIFMNVGYFMKIGSHELLYPEVSLFILFFVSIIYLFSSKLNAKDFFIILLLIISIFISISLPIIFKSNIKILPYTETWENYVYCDLKLSNIYFSSHSLLLVLRVLMFGLILSVGKNQIFDEEISKTIIKRLFSFCILLCVWFFFEALLKYVINPNYYCTIVNKIFGVAQGTYSIPLYRQGICCLQAFFKEPSHLSIGCFLASVIVILNNFFKPQKRNLLIFMILNIYSLLSLSLTSIIFCFSSIVLWLRFGKQNIRFKKLLVGLILIIIALVIILNIPYFRTRIDSAFSIVKVVLNDSLETTKFSTTSGEVPRIVSILYNLKWFFASPIFGLGLGSTYSHSFIPSMLCNIGLTGLILWAIFIKRLVSIKKIDFFASFVLICLFSIQGFLGYFYTISFIYPLLIYFMLSNEKRRIRYDRNCNSEL